VFSGVAPVGGDATGGFTRVTFVPQNPATTPTLPDQRRQYVWFLDGATVHGGPGDFGQIRFQVFTHWARPNAALAMPPLIDVIQARGDIGFQKAPARPPLPTAVSRLPIFWDTQELAASNNQIISITVQSNVNNDELEFSCYGRYYDRQILANRSFSRLISPAAISQFA